MKEDSVHLRMETRGKRRPNGNVFPKSRHGYDSPKRIKDRMKYLGECQALPLNEKFALSVERFREVSKKVKKIFIGWSGGKDSTLVIDIAVASGVENYDVVYADSGVEPIETTDYVKLFSELRGFSFKTLQAPTSFWQMTKTHGWPILGGDRFCMGGGWQANAAKARREGDEIRALAIERAKLSGACSNVLKVVPMDRYAKYVGSDCIVGGSLVTTRFGLEEIKEIPGEFELEGGGVWTQSNDKLMKEGLEVVRVTLRNGLELSGSLDHKVKIPFGLQRRNSFYEEKWKSLGSLKEGDDVLIRAGGAIEFEEISLELAQTVNNLVYPTKMTSELAWLIGFFDSDGSYRRTPKTKERCGVKFNCSEVDLPLVQKRMKKVFGLTQESYPVPIKLGGVRHEQVYYRVGLVPIFEKLALRDFKGILKFGNYYRDYLFGRIQGDGSKAESIGGWRVFISDESQSQTVQQMGFVSGFWARRGWEESEKYELGGIYTIYLTPMIPMNPVDRLSENKVPGVERVKERGLTRKDQSIRVLSRERLKQEGLRINWVVKVERLESEPLFDTVMDAPHAYVSNGFISHNCTSMGLMALETRQRMLVWLQKGDFYWHKSNKKWIFWPIATWKPDDVIAYFRSNNIPMCALYDPGRLNRNGCQACGKSWKWGDNNWMDTYRFHPEIMDDYMVNRGLAQKLLEIKKLYHADQLMRFGVDNNWSGVKIWEHYPEMMLQL